MRRSERRASPRKGSFRRSNGPPSFQSYPSRSPRARRAAAGPRRTKGSNSRRSGTTGSIDVRTPCSPTPALDDPTADDRLDLPPRDRDRGREPIGFHVTLRLEDDRPIATSAIAFRTVARVVLAQGGARGASGVRHRRRSSPRRARDGPRFGRRIRAVRRERAAVAARSTRQVRARPHSPAPRSEARVQHVPLRAPAGLSPRARARSHPRRNEPSGPARHARPRYLARGARPGAPSARPPSRARGALSRSRVRRRAIPGARRARRCGRCRLCPCPTWAVDRSMRDGRVEPRFTPRGPRRRVSG